MVSASIVVLPGELTRMPCSRNISRSDQWYRRDSKIRNGKRRQTAITSVFQSFATVVVRSQEAKLARPNWGNLRPRPSRAAASITNVLIKKRPRIYVVVEIGIPPYQAAFTNLYECKNGDSLSNSASISWNGK
jgi:hypothetical protein